MVQTRSLVLLSCALPLTLLACGGSSDGGTITPTGTHYTYVVDKISVPTSVAQENSYGLDLGSPKSNTPDGLVDNRLGAALDALGGMGFDIQATVTSAVDQGSILLLVDFQTTDFMSAGAAGISVKLGDPKTAMPPACTVGSTTDCRHHLAGTGKFTTLAGSPTNDALAGKIVGGKFSGGPGDVSLQIAIGSSAAPIALSLLNARAVATAITDAGMDTVIGGAVSQADLMGVLTAVNGQIGAALTAGCTGPKTPPDCGCTGTAKSIVNLFDGQDGSAKDCMISVAEIAAQPLIKQLLSPDVCGSKTCPAADAVSIGIKVHTVKATF